MDNYLSLEIGGLSIGDWKQIQIEREYLAHIGVAHDNNPPGPGSGRYPWGSGQRKHQHDWDIKSRIDKYEQSGMTPKEIATAMGYSSTTQLKAVKQMASNAVKMDEFDEINYYMNSTNPATGKTYTPTEIGKILGINESSVRTKYKTGLTGNANKVTETANALKEAVKEKGMVDVGRGAELSFGDAGISPDRLNTALEMLKQEGYVVANIKQKQVANPQQETTIRVLAAPGTTQKDIYDNRMNIRTLEDHGGTDNAAILYGHMDPKFIPLKDVAINYAETGGKERDGLIEIKAEKGPDGKLHAVNPDLDLGAARYAQVRIAVDGGKECITDDNPNGLKYIKGMAVLSTEVPDGEDILVNSNKSIKDGPKKALKDLKMTDTNPFGSTVVQIQRTDKDGKPLYSKDGKPVYSAINFVGTGMDDAHKEGSWGHWSKNLPSQFLAKQSLGLVTQQLRLKAKQSEDELADIEKLNNPVVKRKILQDFSDQCDSDAVALKAAPIGGQGIKVLLPIKSLGDDECYCPSLENGTTVALVRFPHAGPFEIPICKVNNTNAEGKIFAGDGRDMVGINSHVAGKLSGADFDGDTAIVIPMTRKNAQGEFERTVSIKSAPSLPGLDNFDPTEQYSTANPKFKDMVDKKGKPTYHIMTEQEKGIEMGVISNLITDMYAKGCENENELSRAVRYSMVVIDAKKHKLNYQQAYEDYKIQDLKEEYQGHLNSKGKISYGASSILSRSKSETNVKARQQGYDIDPETGGKIFRVYTNNISEKGLHIDPETGGKIFGVYKPSQTQKANRERVKVAAPEGYKQLGSDGKYHPYKYLKDKNGEDIYATTTGKLIQNSDGTYRYDRGNGEDIWATTGFKERTQKSTKMYETDDARTLLSDNPNEIEKAYADYANHMKALGNKARKESLEVPKLETSKEAKEKYATEVASLKEKIQDARRNAPRERQAQLLATSIVNAAYEDHPDWDKDDRKKARGQAIKAARAATGAQQHMVTFTEKEWEAINNGAVSEHFLSQLLEKADKDNYMQLAMPKQNRISDAKRDRIEALYNAGWSYAEIAKAVGGVSTSSVANIVNE